MNESFNGTVCRPVKKVARRRTAGPQAWEEEGYCLIRQTLPSARYEQPVVEPQVSHFKQVPLRTRVKLAQFGHGSPSYPLSRANLA